MRFDTHDHAGDSTAWPAEMFLTEERRDEHLLPLVYAHDAWGINAVPDFTRITVKPAAARRPAGLTHDQLRQAWIVAYRETLAARIRKPVPVDLVDDDIIPALQAWAADAPPAFDDRFRADWDYDAYFSWVDQVAPADDAVDYPDAVVPALVTEWKAGLRTITVLPLSAPLAVRSCPAELVVSTTTRSDARRFEQALRSRHGGFPLAG